MASEDNAREYFNKLKIAERFCGGNIETAKKVLKGEFTDIIALKGRFKDEEEEFFGLLLVFVSRITRKVIDSRSVISHTASVFHHKPFDNWKIFFNKLEKELSEAEVDRERIEVLNGVLSRLHELKVFDNFFEWVSNNDIMNLTDRFQKILNNVLKVDDCHAVLDFENLTSIVLYEEKGIKPVAD